MQSILERFDPASIQWISEAIAASPDLSRSRLTRLVCERLDWRAPNGSHQRTACSLGLRRLEQLGLLRLPEPRWTPLACQLAQLGDIRLIMVNGDPTRLLLWRWLMDSWHPLKSGHLCGAQIRYLVESSNGGLLGGLAFSSAAWRLAARDRWIGWSDETRAARLPLVVNNSRFLLLPQVSVPHLASKILGIAASQLVRDWQTK